jgi:hypothetical protein
MSRDIRRVVADIDALPTADSDDLDRLQGLIDEYFASPTAAAHIDVWFRLYERFPDEHGHGVFWTILHGLEAQPGCDAAVVASVRRWPTHYPVLMVNRMLNADIRSAAGADLLGLLQQVAADEKLAAGVREDAERFLEHQRGRAEPGSVLSSGDS